MELFLSRACALLFSARGVCHIIIRYAVFFFFFLLRVKGEKRTTFFLLKPHSGYVKKKKKKTRKSEHAEAKCRSVLLHERLEKRH